MHDDCEDLCHKYSRNTANDLKEFISALWSGLKQLWSK